MEAQFEIKGQKFSLKKVNALEQFHIARRLMPVLSEMLPGLGKLSKNMKDLEKLTQEQQFDEISQAMSPAMNSLSKLNDKDSEYVLFGLLSCAQFHQAEHNLWLNIADKSGIKVPLEFPVLMQVAGRALMFNIGDFLASRPRSS